MVAMLFVAGVSKIACKLYNVANNNRLIPS